MIMTPEELKRHDVKVQIEAFNKVWRESCDMDFETVDVDQLAENVVAKIEDLQSQLQENTPEGGK